MNEVVVSLDKFKARDYQLPVFKALEKDGYKRLVVIWPRRSGKDLVGFNIIIRQAFKRVGTYYYVFPTFSSGRRILWDAITSGGSRVLDYLPREVIESTNEQQMRIKLINGSMIQIIGSDNFDNTIVGTNPVGMIFSEYALQDERAYSMSKPILAGNDGWALFLSTPRAKNHLFSLWQIAVQNPAHWYSNILTVKETKHISEEEIQADIDRGEISYDLAMQEYYCSFDMGIDGAVYGKALDRMKLNEQITNVPWQSNHVVQTSWDIGNDCTAIIFYQIIGQSVNVIDCFQKSGEQLEYYINMINSKPYTYGKHYVPFDMGNIEWGGKKFSRVEKARQLGLKVNIVDSVGLEDGIEYVKSCMSKIWIDSNKCKELITALESYRYEWDRKKGMYKDIPLHDKHSHFADSFRYLSLSLPKSRDSMSQQDADNLKRQALYGNDPKFSPVFEQPDNRYFGY
ncbi:hypothetical protein [Methylobacter sp.]|uniref:hypothetical protein n=1 Tax=Methylobacter sp. TaxID=2051955 RepID=UPI003DA3851C